MVLARRATASLALKRFFGADEATFRMDAIVNGVTSAHAFTRYTDAGLEARAARISGGMHYDFSNEAGARIGRQIVRQLVERRLFKRSCAADTRPTTSGTSFGTELRRDWGG